MLSLFPSLLSYDQISPLLIRITLGAVFIFWRYKNLKSTSTTLGEKAVAILEVIAGILLVIGLWTQVAALFATIDLVGRIIERVQKRAFLTDGINYYLLLLVMAISLLVTGAGFLAFDLPL